MNDEKKTKDELIAEVTMLRERVRELEGDAPTSGEAAAALHESEEKFRSLAEKSPNMIFINSGGKVVYANERSTEIMGYAREELYAEAFDYMCLIAPDSLEAIKNAYEHHMKGEEVPPFEYGLLAKNGTRIDAILTTKLMTYNGNVGILGIATDVTERKRAEENLRDSEQRYRAIFEQAADCVMLADARTGTLIEFNDALCHVTGYYREELLKLTLSDIDALESEEELDEHIEMIQREGSDQFETKIRRKDGELRDFHLKVKAISISGKEYIHGVGRDITDEKMAQAELKSNFSRLEKVLEGTVNGLASMAEQKDSYTAGHQRKVSEICRQLAWEMGLPAEQIQGVRIAGTLHDIGKVSVPAEIITKPAKLTEVEFALVKTHCRVGYNILVNIEFPWPVARIVLEHHERINGSGYPNGLKGDQILLESKILAVSDVVEAMSSNRPYRMALSEDKIIEEIRNNKGILYDRAVVEACLRLFHLRRIDLT